MAVKSEKKTAKPAGKKSQPMPDLSKFLDEVKNRAYELYLQRQKTGQTGDEMSDWLKAEKEIKARYKI